MKSNVKNIDKKPFFSSVKELRDRAREHMKLGAVTADYALDVGRSIEVLNEALSTEMVCYLRYLNHYYMAEGIQSESIKAEFLEHANEEREHAERIATRIRQLNGVPDLNPARMMNRSHSEYMEGETLVQMIEEDLYAERIAIESYREMVSYFGNKDSSSRRLLEDILAKEEEHAEELSSLLLTMNPAERSKTA